VKKYRFPDFRQALAFVNRVGELAEEEGITRHRTRLGAG
jgi:pterin-4a-carbinolamine dehydratase